MDLSLVDQLLLLSLNDEKGNFTGDSNSLGIAVSMGIIFELALKNRISISDKNIIVQNSEGLNDELLDFCFSEIVKFNKPRSLKEWVQDFQWKFDKIKQMSLQKLIDLGILKQKEEKFLWIFSKSLYPSENLLPENQLRRRIYEIVFNGERPSVQEIILLGIIDSLNLTLVFFGEKTKVESKKILKDYYSRIDEFGLINDTVKIINEEILALSTSLMTFVSTTTVLNSLN
ncbi:MAG: GPP34 family phosphoprotein [Bacteroidales bacterium]